MSLRLNFNELKEIRLVVGQCHSATAEREIFASQKRAFILYETVPPQFKPAPAVHPIQCATVFIARFANFSGLNWKFLHCCRCPNLDKAPSFLYRSIIKEQKHLERACQLPSRTRCRLTQPRSCLDTRFHHEIRQHQSCHRRRNRLEQANHFPVRRQCR